MSDSRKRRLLAISSQCELMTLRERGSVRSPAPILSVFPALIVHSELKSVHPGFSVAFIFQAQVN